MSDEISDAFEDDEPISDARPNDDLGFNFGGFVIGLYQSAMVSLGEMEHPETGATVRDLEGARHTIDILKMLKHKTANNLDTEEEKLIGGLLYKLQMVYAGGGRGM